MIVILHLDIARELTKGRLTKLGKNDNIWLQMYS